jgi:RNA polymerase sigma-70 factor (ECF subfamily)
MALDTLVRRHRDRVFAIARGVVRDPDDAADVTQETFIAVVRYLEAFDGRSRFSTWLHRIAVRKAYDFLRVRRPEPVGDAVAELAGSSADPHETHLAGRDLHDAIAQLDESFRGAVLLVDVLGWTVQEAAEALEVAPGTVKSRVFRGRAQVAALLGTRGHSAASKGIRSEGSEE